MRWAVVKGFPSLIVSEAGDVVRLASSRQVRAVNGRLYWAEIPEKRLQPRLAGAGYPAVQTKVLGKYKTLYIHRLIAEAFIQKPFDCNEVNHKDGNKTNNAISNLEWTTHSRNLRHACATGLYKGRSLAAAEVLDIKRRLSVGERFAAIARDYGVSPKTIASIKSGRSWAWLSEAA